VETVSVQYTSSYKVRKLSLKQASSNQTRIIHHLHFTEWPDHGVPQDSKHFLGKYFFVTVHCCVDIPFAVNRLGVKIKSDGHVEVAVQRIALCLDCS